MSTSRKYRMYTTGTLCKWNITFLFLYVSSSYQKLPEPVAEHRSLASDPKIFLIQPMSSFIIVFKNLPVIH